MTSFIVLEEMISFCSLPLLQRRNSTPTAYNRMYNGEKVMFLSHYYQTLELRCIGIIMLLPPLFKKEDFFAGASVGLSGRLFCFSSMSTSPLLSNPTLKHRLHSTASCHQNVHHPSLYPPLPPNEGVVPPSTQSQARRR